MTSSTRVEPPTKRACYPKISLTDLAEDNLKDILDYLDAEDLVNVCMVCQRLCQLGQARLYSKIAIFDHAEDRSKYLKSQMATLDGVPYTAICLKKLPKLVMIFKRNKNLARLVKSVYVDDFVPRSIVHKFLRHVNLTDLYCAGEQRIPPYITSNLKRLTCYVEPCAQLMESIGIVHMKKNENWCYEEYSLEEDPSLKFQNLTELQILFDESTHDHDNFETLASAMIDRKVYQHLKTLAITLKNSCADEESRSSSPWNTLFYYLDGDDCVLKLDRLKLQGVKSDFKLGEINSAVDLSNLKSLEVNFQPDYDSAVPWRADDFFLPSLLKLTTSLEELSVFYYWDNDMFTRSLTEILRANSLKKLSIAYEMEISSGFLNNQPPDLSLVPKAILSSQSHLETLSIETYGETPILEYLYSYKTPFSKENKNKQIIERSKMVRTSPIIMNLDLPATFRSEEDCEDIRSHKEDIRAFLESDLIYKDAATKMPFLKRYTVSGFEIDVKKKAILLNGEVIPLESV